MTAGYSGTPLPTKLGIKPGIRLRVDGPPPGFALELPDGVTQPARGRYHVVLCFCPDVATLRRRFGPLATRLTDGGRLWIAWPKKASGVRTDLDENAVRSHGLSTGLVDVKVCAIDVTWSGLAFVVRLADRQDAGPNGGIAVPGRGRSPHPR